MRILTLVNSLNMGGVEKTLLNCLPYLGKNGDSFIVCCFQTQGELEKRFLENGVEIVSIKKTGSIMLDCIQLLKVIRKYKIDIIHSRFSYTSGGFVLAAFFMNRSSIVSIHSSKPVGFGKYKNIFPIGFLLKQQLKLHKLIVRSLADRIVGHSKANLNVNFKNWNNSKEKFKVIYNGVDFMELSGGAIDGSILNGFIKNSQFNILHIGSMRSPKNHIFLLDCFKLLEPEKNNYRLILVGGGELSLAIKQKIKELELDDYVYLAGFDSSIGKYLSVANMFFFPSIIEGFANVLVEAQYMKVPICASNLPAFEESVYPAYHKYFFDPRNHQDAIDSFKRLKFDIDNGNLKETIENARKYTIDNFEVTGMADSLLSLYKELKR